ncbi:MAG: carboxypeptidase-like regulatory domain-containing protein, partial [Bacteroidia bacterium]|nr:carboxypeptidase-like regulatory domain-containing protein [Bacteroidia bacterium]
FGEVPLTLLDAVPGNQTLFTATRTFDLLDYYEFVTDQYASLHIEHNFNGRIFSRLPLLRKLNLREIIGARAVVGSLSEENIALNVFDLSNRSPNKPYYEYHVGVGNIFKLLRIDFVFRGNYLDLPGATKFAIKGGVGFHF